MLVHLVEVSLPTCSESAAHGRLGIGLIAAFLATDTERQSVVFQKKFEVIAYRGVRCDASLAHDHTESVALLKADSWDGMYERMGEVLFVDNEDVYMWLDDRGRGFFFSSK